MKNKIEGGKLVAEHMLRAEQVVADALAESTAFKFALIAAQSQFSLQPAIFASLIASVEASEVAILHAQRNQKRAHIKVLRIRSDERLADESFGCDKSCFPAAMGADRPPSLTKGYGAVHAPSWHSSLASSSSYSPSAATASGEAEHRSGLQA